MVEMVSEPTRREGKVEQLAVPLGMVLVQVITTGMLILSKVAFNSGMEPFVFIVYRTLIGAATVLPLAIIFERDMVKKLNLSVMGWIFINALFGVPLAMGFYCYGMRNTDAAYAVIFLNLIPVVTFVIAIIVRAEKLVLNRWPGRMKLLGTVVCVSGTMVVSRFKGKMLHLWPTNLMKAENHGAASRHQDMVAGTLFLCGSCLSYALWFIVQARLAKVFPSKYLATTLTCLFGSVQSIAVGLTITTAESKWILKWDLQLLTVVFSGVFSSGVTYVLMMWAISRRGPIYPPIFNCLMLILTTIMDSVLLGTNIYIGSVLGALLIIVGLYAFLWGESKLAGARLTRKKSEQQHVMISADGVYPHGDLSGEFPIESPPHTQVQ